MMIGFFFVAPAASDLTPFSVFVRLAPASLVSPVTAAPVLSRLTPLSPRKLSSWACAR
jgi:hypothetical protein